MAKGAKVLFLTGKGGVGKTFLADRLAAELAALTGRVALVSLGPLDGAPSTAEATHSDVEFHPLDEQKALARLLARLVGFRFLSERLLDSRTFTAVTAAAPGVREFVTLTFLEDVASRDRYRWVVVDGPASGHSVTLLGSAARMARIAPFGPAARLARAIERFATDPRRFRAVIVSTPEELAAREAVETDARLREIGVSPQFVIVNGMYPELAHGTQAEWLERHSTDGDALLYLARRRRQRSVAADLISELGAIEIIPRVLPGLRAADEAVHDFATRLASRP
jgi:arsenite-transporting ATPase